MKQDLTQLKESAIPNNRSKEKIEHEKALKVLEEAKKIPRVVVFLKPGESEFTRKLNKKNSEKNPDLFATKEAAEYLGLSLNSFNVRKKKYKIPFTIENNRRVYKKITLDKHIKEYPKLK